MTDFSKQLKKIRKKTKIKRAIKLSKPRHMGSRPFSEVFSAYDTTGQEYVIKIGKTSESIKYEYKQYKNANSLGINTLVPVCYSKKSNAMVSERKDIKPVYIHLLYLKNRSEYYEMLTKLGQFACVLETKTLQSEIKEFCIVERLKERLREQECLSCTLTKKISDWLDINTSEIHQYATDYTLSTDFNFYNVHVDSRKEFVLVDLADAIYAPKQSNIAYMHLQFKFNRVRKLKMKYSDFNFFLRGYNGGSYPNDKAFKAFEIYHLISMVEFYKANMMQRHNLFSKLKAIYDSVIKTRLMENYVRQLLNEI